MSELVFHRTLSIDDVKEQQKASFKILRKKSGGLFFKCGQLVGHVSEKIDINNIDPNNLTVSLVENTDGQFWMLHNSSNDNVVMEL